MATRGNNLVNPNAREAMNRFKMEAAGDVGVSLKQGYNGDLTSRQAGSVGGQMVNNICPERTKNYDRECRIAPGHSTVARYIFSLMT